MKSIAIDYHESLIDALIESMEAALSVPEGMVPPVALLWTDANGQWKPIIRALQAKLPQLYVLGDYNPEARTGPVIWLRCIVDRTLPDMAPSEGMTPVLYLPNVSRQQLRAGGDCPKHLQPLIELQYRGAVWHQRNGRDWSVEAFLTSRDALDLDMATDARTKDAMMRALPLLASEPLATLRGRRVEAEDFDRLTVGDPIRDILMWMCNSEGFHNQCDGARWESFRSVCNREYNFDPDQFGPVQVGELLLEGHGNWEQVWQRFCEAPRFYADVINVLRNTTPRDLLSDASRQPRFNTEEEENLRAILEKACKMPHAEACNKILELEKTHGQRRQWVWAQLGESPLATLLEPLAKVALQALKPLGGDSVETIAHHYATDGWRCDAAAMRALAISNTTSDTTLLHNLLRAIYLLWLEKSAQHFQKVAVNEPEVLRKSIKGIAPQSETCIVFVDGLRYDVAGMLEESLESRGCRVRLTHRLAPVPSVTATAKPMVSPAYTACEETSTYGVELCPAIGEKHQASNAKLLRDEMTRQGIAVLEEADLVTTSDTQHGGWVEIGQLDSLGHKLNVRLAMHIDKEIEGITERVLKLLSEGWERVRIVTDHGWLLVPGSLPKVEIPAYLTETKWARCAIAQGEPPNGFPVFPWHWNPHFQIVSPPGIGSFFAGKEYGHGGISPQECVIPDMWVETDAGPVTARIASIRWRGMRCRVRVETNHPEVQVDLRLSLRKKDTSIVAKLKKVADNNEVSLAVADDSHEGVAAIVVLLDAGGQILDKQHTQVGEE